MSKRRIAKLTGAARERSASERISRRTFVTGAGLVGLSAASSHGLGAPADSSSADGTPEQIHLTWGEDPTSSVCISWVSSAQALNPRVHIAPSASPIVHAVQRTYTDGLNGQTVFTYHARLTGLRANAEFQYSVTADNDRNRARPFAATFKTAPRGRQPFRWTS